MQPWKKTNEKAFIDVVKQDGKEYIKYPQYSRINDKGEKEVHPAFIDKDGSEQDFILIENDGQYGKLFPMWEWVDPKKAKFVMGKVVVLPVAQGTNPVGDYAYSTGNINANRGPCGIPRNERGAMPFFPMTSQRICRSDPINCRDCPMNPNRKQG